MKEVVAVIRATMINQTKRALADAGIASMTATNVLGRGSSRFKDTLAYGEEATLNQSQRLIAKRMLFVVVPDKQVKTVVNTLIEVNQTGKVGDGKIWVMPFTNAARVRTGESGNAAINEV